ncbi:MAG: rod-binding protein [Alphaproteobacteria bacterium]
MTTSAILGQAQVALDQSHSMTRAPGPGRNFKQVQKTAQDFEAVFISQMLKPMFNSLSTDGLFGGGQGEEMFRSFLVDEYGKTIARSGGIGISGPIMNAMLSAQTEHRP